MRYDVGCGLGVVEELGGGAVALALGDGAVVEELGREAAAEALGCGCRWRQALCGCAGEQEGGGGAVGESFYATGGCCKVRDGIRMTRLASKRYGWSCTASV